MTALASRAREFLVRRFGAELPAGAFATLALRVAHAALEFLALLLLARLLGAAAFGVYAVAIACANVLGVPAAAGFDRLLVREVAALVAVNRGDGRLGGILRLATRVVLASSCMLALLLAAVAMFVVEDAALRPALLLAAVLLPLVAFARLRQAAVQGLGHVPAGTVAETVVQPLSLLLLAALAFAVLDFERIATNAVFTHLAAALIAFVSGLLVMRRLWPRECRGAAPLYETRRWLGAAAPLMWLLGMNTIMTNADTILLGWLGDATDAGPYRVASQMAMLVTFPTTAINLAVAPTLARLYATGQLLALWEQTLRASRMSLLAALPIALTLLAAGGPLLGLFGAEFGEARAALAVLTVGYCAIAFSGAAGYLLIMTRHEKLTAWVFTLAACLNVAGNFLLIPRFGLAGAAVATGISATLMSLALLHFARRLFRR
jgi:O-antigen/teichoic acid export membrane protein